MARVLSDERFLMGVGVTFWIVRHGRPLGAHRAPRWMQLMALEWLYRLLHNPRRLAHRYLNRGPRLLGHLLFARIVLRKRRTASIM